MLAKLHGHVKSMRRRVAWWRHKRRHPGSSEVDEDGGEVCWWPDLTEEDRSSFKGAI